MRGLAHVQHPLPQQVGHAARELPGADLVGGLGNASIWARIMGFLALVLAAVNIFGGFLVTQRMLAMYKKK